MTPQLQPDDPLSTSYSVSEGRKNQIVTRRVCQARDLNGFIKDAAAELGFPRSHFSSTSLRKWGPTEGCAAAGDGGYSQAMGGWMSGATMTAHYNKIGLSYRPIADRGGVALTKKQVRAMVPVMLTHGGDEDEHDVVAMDGSSGGEDGIGCVTSSEGAEDRDGVARDGSSEVEDGIGCVTSSGSAAAGGSVDTLSDVSGVAQAEADTAGVVDDQAQANVDRFVAEVFGM